MGMTWALISFQSEMGNTVKHIVPEDDLREHDLIPDCWCEPTLDEENWTAVHNSADNREAFETGERKPS